MVFRYSPVLNRLHINLLPSSLSLSLQLLPGFFSPLSLEFSFGAMHKAQVVCAWVTLGGGWSKFQVQSQQTATVLRWRNLPPPALWVYIFWLIAQLPHSNQMCQVLTVYYLSLFSITSSIKMRNNIQKMGNTSAKSSCPFSSKGTLTVFRKHLSRFRSYCLTQFYFFFFLAAIFFLFQGRVGAYLLQRPTKTRGQTHQGLQRNVKQVRVTLSFVSFVFNMTSSWDWLPCTVQE